MSRKDTKGRSLRTGESQRKDGLYMYRYTDAKSGKRISIYDPNLANLREKERQIARDLEDGIEAIPKMSRMTVNELFDRYMSTKVIAETTRENYMAIWNRHVRDCIGQLRVTKIKPSDIKAFYAQLTKQNYSHSTLKIIHNLLYPSFEMAIDDDIVRKNPARNTLQDSGKPPKEKQALTPTQQDKLVEFVKQSSVYNEYLPMLHIMLGTACRCGELIGLTWNDVDMERKEITIDKQLIYKNFGDGYKFHVSKPKTKAGMRVIPMTNVVYDAFRMQNQINALLQLPTDVMIDGYADFVFKTRNGNPIMPSAVNSILYGIVGAYNRQEQACAVAEQREPEYMPSISAHTMRHTSCTRMAEHGMDMKVVQRVMGHAGITVTMQVYNHITEQSRVTKEIDKMNMEMV